MWGVLCIAAVHIHPHPRIPGVPPLSLSREKERLLPNETVDEVIVEVGQFRDKKRKKRPKYGGEYLSFFFFIVNIKKKENERDARFRVRVQ